MRKEAKPWGRILYATRLEKYVLAQHFRSAIRMVAEGLRPGDRCAEIEGKLPSYAANFLARVLLQSDCDSILFVDSDADFTSDTLDKLRDLKDGWNFDIFQPFVTGRRWPPLPVWLVDDPDRKFRMKEIRDPNLTEEVAGVGLHFTLMRREIFDDPRLTHPWFAFPPDAEENGSEDLTFCMKARDLGYSIGATSKVRVGHWGDTVYGWETLQGYYLDRDERLKMEKAKMEAQTKMRAKVPPKVGEWGFDPVDAIPKTK